MLVEDPQIFKYIESAFKNEPEKHSQNVSLLFSKMNFDLYFKNFTEDAREYMYQSWNHFAHRNKIHFRREIKQKNHLVEDDFTELEISNKKIIDNLPSSKVARDASLRYQYSPEICFNSMIDVFEILEVTQPLDIYPPPEKYPTKKMVYNPRIFTYPRDSLYIYGEFPPNYTPSSKYLKLKTIEGNLSHSSKYRKIKEKISENSEYILSKPCFAIKFKRNSTENLMLKSATYLVTESEDEEDEIRDARYLKHKSSMMNEGRLPDYLPHKFLADFVEIDSRHMYRSREADSLLPQDLYEGIREGEKAVDTIQVLNWSGEQVFSASVYPKSRTDKAISSLNFQDTIIWLRGFSGMFIISRKIVRKIIESSIVDKFLTFCVLCNTFLLMLDGLTSPKVDYYMNILNTTFTFIFVLELVTKLYALGPRLYAKSIMNLFDACIVIISLIEVTIAFSTQGAKAAAVQNSGSGISAFRALRILRMFRVLRVTRILRTMKFMKVIVAVIIETAEQYTYVAIILLLFIFIYALLGMQIYAGNLIYSSRLPRYNFDTFGPAFFTLFQILTIENWTDIVEVCYSSKISPALTLIYILSWLIIGNYIFLNLFLALLLGGFDNVNVVKSLEETNDEFKELQEVILLRKELESVHKEQIILMKRRQQQNVKYILKHEDHDGIEDDEEQIDILEEEQQKVRASYTLVRNTMDDDSSMEDLLFRAIHNKIKPKARKKLIDTNRQIYEGVYCDSTLFLFTRQNIVRRIAAHIASHFLFEPVIVFLIILSSLKLVIETYFDGPHNVKEKYFFDMFDNIINIIFVFEFLFKVLRNGFYLDKNSYLSDPWSWLDLVIMVTSVLDMLLSDLSIPMIKVFRTLRPLRFVAHYKHMRIVVNSLVGALGPLLNVSLVMLLVWLIFAILAMNFVGDKLWYCDLDDPYGVNKASCAKQGKQWKRAFWNFDNIAESFVSLFVLVSMEGWPNLAASSLDAGDNETSGPFYNGTPMMIVYFYAFILIGKTLLTSRLNVLNGSIYRCYLLSIRSGAREGAEGRNFQLHR